VCGNINCLAYQWKWPAWCAKRLRDFKCWHLVPQWSNWYCPGTTVTMDNGQASRKFTVDFARFQFWFRVSLVTNLRGRLLKSCPHLAMVPVSSFLCHIVFSSNFKINPGDLAPRSRHSFSVKSGRLQLPRTLKLLRRFLKIDFQETLIIIQLHSRSDWLG